MKAQRPAGGAAGRAAAILGAALAGALVAGLVSFAATTPAAAATRWYHVEVVLFAQGADDAAWRRNDWREEGPPDLAKNTVELLPGLDADGLPAGSNRRHAFRTLPPSALDLGAVADRLDRSNDYRVLLHVGWNQPGFSEDEAPAVHLGTLGALAGSEGRSAGPGGEEVEGAVRFWRRRFLHVDIDLSFGDIEAWRERKEGAALPQPGGESTVPGLTTAGARTGTPALPAGGATGRAGGSDAEGDEPETDARRVAGADEPLRVARLTRSLRLRSGRLHYIDHPLFGVLLVVRRLD